MKALLYVGRGMRRQERREERGLEGSGQLLPGWGENAAGAGLGDLRECARGGAA